MKRGKRFGTMIFVFLLSFIMICGILPADSVNAAKKLSAKERKRYTKILKNKEYVKDSEGLIYDEADFMLYDMNNDGRKELIVTGPLQLRSVFGTVVYSYNGKKFRCCTRQGEAVCVSKKGIELDDTDYEGAGEIFYESLVVYKMNAKGQLEEKVMADIVIDEVKSTSAHDYYKYNASGKKVKISKSAYKKLRQKYKLKEVKKVSGGMHKINSRNIKKYIK